MVAGEAAYPKKLDSTGVGSRLLRAAPVRRSLRILADEQADQLARRGRHGRVREIVLGHERHHLGDGHVRPEGARSRAHGGLGGEVSVPALTKLLAGEPDASELAVALCAALGARETDEPPELFWAFRRLFETLARRGPTVVFLEDLHWADATLLDLVERLVDAIRDAPLLFVCLARPELLEQRPAWGGGKVSSSSLLLEPLTPDESLELIELRRRDLDLPDESRARISERAEGNPLYIEQVLALLLETGPEAEPTIPPSIHALIEARLDALTTEERRLLQHGAVAGREFGRAEVGLLLGTDPGDELVDSLTRKELLASGGNGVLRFRHATIRDVAYSTVPNEALAEWLERDEGGGARADEAIAYHLEQVLALRSELGAADPELRPLRRRAGARLTSAGRRAQGRSEAKRAIDLLARAALYVEDDSRAALLIDLAAVQRVAGEFEEATRRLDEASALAAANGDDALVHKAVLVKLQMQGTEQRPSHCPVQLPTQQRQVHELD